MGLAGPVGRGGGDSGGAGGGEGCLRAIIDYLHQMLLKNVYVSNMTVKY